MSTKTVHSNTGEWVAIHHPERRAWRVTDPDGETITWLHREECPPEFLGALEDMYHRGRRDGFKAGDEHRRRVIRDALQGTH